MADVGLTEGGERTTVEPGAAVEPGVPSASRFAERLPRWPDWPRRHPRLAWAAGLAVAALVLYAAYLRQAQTLELDADPAAQALQAWQMLHGNLLLSGWWLGDISFYTVELPLNMLIELVYGLRPGEVHILAALIYTAVVLLGALLARGNARGGEGIVRALLAAGIMLAPSLQYGTEILLQGPNHTGTIIPILVMLLILDRAPEERWWVPVAVGVLLVWGQVNDPLATYAAALPVALACGVRACAEIARRRRPPWARWYDTSLAVAALLSIGLAHLILSEIHKAGGFYMPPPRFGTGFVPVTALPAQFWVTIYCVLILFGADFIGQQMGINAILAILHLAGVALGFWGLWIGLRGFFSRIDRVTQVLVAGTIIVLAAGAFGPYMTPVAGAHEIVTVLPFCAVLAGRLLGPRLAKARLEPVLALGLVCYLGALAHNDLQPVQTPWHQDLANWLETHHLTNGLSGGGEANITTLDSDGRVRLAPLFDGGASAHAYESDYAWYNPAVSQANFIVTVTWPPGDVADIKPSVIAAQFGPPAHTYQFKEYTIRVYDYNLLTRLQIPAIGGFKSP
jgi:hypothetical protein